VTISTTEAGNFAGGFDGNNGEAATVSPGTPETVFDTLQDPNNPNPNPIPGPVYTIAFPLSAVAPSGAAPAGISFAGLNVAGAACVVNATLWA
jgi:hypothetical protein